MVNAMIGVSLPRFFRSLSQELINCNNVPEQSGGRLHADSLREVRSQAGKSEKNRRAIALMDGSKSQSTIVKEAGIDQGNLSRLVKALAKASLIASDEKHPKLLITIPFDFFEHSGNSNE